VAGLRAAAEGDHRLMTQQQGPTDAGQGYASSGDEDERKRDRQMIELLNELRVALPGVQILFAFLLTVPFSARYGFLSLFQRDVYYVTLVATALSTACLIAPSAAHRLRFHQSERAWVIESANHLTIAGLALLAVAMGGAVLMITDILFDGARVWIYSATVWLATVALWFVRPLARHARGKSSGP
jgi:hypothetical protein